jgi:hypothetical protein
MNAILYTEITGFTNIYGTSEFGMLGTYSHKFKPVSLKEMVWFDGIIHHHGIQGGGLGIHLCWDLVYNDVSHTRFLQLKWMYKLNNISWCQKATNPDIIRCTSTT